MVTVQEIWRKLISKLKWKYVVSLSIIIGILGGIAEFSGYSLIDLWSSNDEREYFDIAVFVRRALLVCVCGLSYL